MLWWCSETELPVRKTSDKKLGYFSVGIAPIPT